MTKMTLSCCRTYDEPFLGCYLSINSSNKFEYMLKPLLRGFGIYIRLSSRSFSNSPF